MAHFYQTIIPLGEDDHIIATAKSARIRVRRDYLGRLPPRSDQIINQDNTLIKLADIIITTRSLQRETRSQRLLRIQREALEAHQSREAHQARKANKALKSLHEL